MSLDFLLQNMYKTCVYLHFKIETFSKYMLEINNFLKLRACINVHVIFSLNTYVKHSNDYMLSL
jgi:hypothetical protein